VPVAYQPGMFDLGGLNVPHIPELGFAGLRIHHDAGGGSTGDEFAVFLGASYFRLIASGQEYGVSGRGIAVETGGDQLEEFPDFIEFWIARPVPGGGEVTVLALLDGPSLTGAYRFRLWPGARTTVQVDAALFFRRRIGQLGLAPLTSMFLHGENGPRTFEDFRPEMHDSDGLLLASADGEWSWRPLVNGRAAPRTTDYRMRTPHGFGLMQRDRRFGSYLDVQAMHERRPSMWVEPWGDWGEGVIQLYEFPSLEEYNDNVVAYWVPDRPLEAGAGLEYGYAITMLDAGTDLAQWPGPASVRRKGCGRRCRPRRIGVSSSWISKGRGCRVTAPGCPQRWLPPPGW
jgi:glucans biosynthesis protein